MKVADLKVALRSFKPQAKIMFLDVETAPSLGWVWGKWEQNVIDFHQDGYTLSFSLKKAWTREIITKGLPDYPETWAKDHKDDSALLAELWMHMNEADIIVAHNGDKFDIPTIYTRFVELGFRPPRPAGTVDTLKIARNKFKFKSNKLDDLGRDLGIGRKMAHTGAHLWFACMNGDAKAWRLMLRYNKRDTLLLEELYYRFLPWATSTHPNVNQGNEGACIRCGSYNVKHEGYRFTNLRKKERIHCLNCHAWFEGSARKV
jgi:DNA polymerase elongation subunit (family B)